MLYLTVGTGIGGGAMAGGQLLHGLGHPEMGHLRIPHDVSADPFPGCCPFHGDCLEGLASGFAIEKRWGSRGQCLPETHPAWELEAHYLALGLMNWVCTLSPKRIIVGGGVMRQRDLLPLMREKLTQLLERLCSGAGDCRAWRWVMMQAFWERSRWRRGIDEGMTNRYVLADRSLGQRLERAEGRANASFVEARARVSPATGAEWIEVAGAYAMFDGVDSPCTQTFGLGMFAVRRKPIWMRSKHSSTAMARRCTRGESVGG